MELLSAAEDEVLHEHRLRDGSSISVIVDNVVNVVAVDLNIRHRDAPWVGMWFTGRRVRDSGAAGPARQQRTRWRPLTQDIAAA